MRLGVLGGTFNPVHFGHLRTAEEVAESLQLSTVVFIPAAQPPHKGKEGLLSFEHRWRMLELAVLGNPRFVLSDLEYQRPGKSYSVETLSQLASGYGGAEAIYFLVGLDAFLELPTWKRYLELFSLCHFVVVARPGYHWQEAHSMLTSHVSADFTFDATEQVFAHPRHLTVYYREVTLMDISSSKIRERLAAVRSVRYLLPEKVESYIQRQGLYRRPPRD